MMHKNIKKTLNSIKNLSHRRNFTLRNEEIGKKASIIATNKIVRKFIDKQQHIIVKKILQKFKGCVIDGRDIGSKVFKNAQIKLFIDVNVEIRAKRRHKQLIEQGERNIYSRILKDLKLRDKKDLNRKISPLIKPHKAILIDNSKSFKNTCNQINNILLKKTKAFSINMNDKTNTKTVSNSDYEELIKKTLSLETNKEKSIVEGKVVSIDKTTF